MTSRRGSSREGSMFGGYELRSLLGAGGMGEVYKAYDTVKDRMVAVKLLKAEFAADGGLGPLHVPLETEEVALLPCRPKLFTIA